MTKREILKKHIENNPILKNFKWSELEPTETLKVLEDAMEEYALQKEKKAFEAGKEFKLGLPIFKYKDFEDYNSKQ